MLFSQNETLLNQYVQTEEICRPSCQLHEVSEYINLMSELKVTRQDCSLSTALPDGSCKFSETAYLLFTFTPFLGLK